MWNLMTYASKGGSTYAPAFQSQEIDLRRVRQKNHSAHGKLLRNLVKNGIVNDVREQEIDKG
jgi:hypothetical protein